MRKVITMSTLTHSIRILPLATLLLLGACGEGTDVFQTPAADGTQKNSGAVSARNFALASDDGQPKIIDLTKKTFTQTDVKLTVTVADRNNHILTDSHVVYFRAKYGIFNAPSCTTKNGQCQVTWTALKWPNADEYYIDPSNNGIYIKIIAYTKGEEGFNDVNSNGFYDDGDGNTFDDLGEPYVDVNGDQAYTSGEPFIDTVNGNDTSGNNGVYDIADGFFNGDKCTHSSLCSSVVKSNGTIWTETKLKIDGPP